MGRLSTHVLDTAHGHPAGGMEISLWRLDGKERRHLKTIATNADGRTDEPLLAGGDFRPGTYELVFNVGEYFRSYSAPLPEPMFLSDVIVRFNVADASENYHVPLLVSPWSYSTYRGS
jgi:5-hydroxyisourate hydrolase